MDWEDEFTLSNQTVEVLIVGSLNAQVATADVVDGLVIDHEAAVGVLEGGMGGKDRVVWLNHRGSNLGSGIDAEFKLALLAIVDRQAFHEQGSKPRSSTTAEGVEDQEPLETRAVVCNMAYLVENLVNEFFSDRVMTTRIIVGSVLLPGDHLFRVKQAAVGTSANFVNHIWFKVAVDGTGNVFAVTLKNLQLAIAWASMGHGLHVGSPVSEKKVLNP